MKTISFFSYKGGAGRSSVAYNVIPLLADSLKATEDQPIIVVDLDIDSAGITYLLGANSMDLSQKIKVQDITRNIPGQSRTIDEVPLKAHPFFSRLIPVGEKFGLQGIGANDRIRLLPVDVIGERAPFDQGGPNILGTLREMCLNYKCKAIIFDTPTGNQLTARWALSVSRNVVACMRITHQFRLGTIDFLKVRNADYSHKRFIIVPNAIPFEEIKIDGIPYSIESVRHDIINRINSEIGNERNTFSLKMLEVNDGIYGIPEVKRFKIKEGLLYTIKEANRTEDETKALLQYQRLVDIITDEG